MSDSVSNYSISKPTGKIPVISSSIGKKLFMAVTGAAFILFVIGHLAGNLLFFAGQDALNSYALALKELPLVIWSSRVFLLLFFVTHIFLGIKLVMENRSARPIKYARVANVTSTLPSRTMILSGLVLLFFVIYHLLHFTFLTTNPEYSTLVDSSGRFDVYSMVIYGFSNVYISAAYIIAVIFLSMHLYHGFFSMFQTFGATRVHLIPKLQLLSKVFSILILLGYLSIPIAVLTGFANFQLGGGN